MDVSIPRAMSPGSSNARDRAPGASRRGAGAPATGTMRLSLRFLLPLTLALGLIAYGVAPLVDDLTLKWFVRDLESRTHLIATAVQEPLAEMLADEAREKVRSQRLESFFNRIIQDERLFAIGFCDADGRLAYRTATLPRSLACRAQASPPEEHGRILQQPSGKLLVSTTPIEIDVATLHALPQPGCARLEVTTRQRDVLEQGKRADQELRWQVSFCRDGSFPEKR